MFPVMASMCIGATQMVTQSFLVYLKYQALVDSYYHQELQNKEKEEQITEK